MLGLTLGEFGLVAYITVAIVTAKYFPLLGERLALLLFGGRASDGDRDSAGKQGSS